MCYNLYWPAYNSEGVGVLYLLLQVCSVDIYTSFIDSGPFEIDWVVPCFISGMLAEVEEEFIRKFVIIFPRAPCLFFMISHVELVELKEHLSNQRYLRSHVEKFLRSKKKY